MTHRLLVDLGPSHLTLDILDLLNETRHLSCGCALTGVGGGGASVADWRVLLSAWITTWRNA